MNHQTRHSITEEESMNRTACLNEAKIRITMTEAAA
jgi:hypothetical protein